VESAVAYGLSAALGGEITIEKGRVKQGSFDDYPILTLDRMPEVIVNIAVTDPGYQHLGGIGEPGLPPTAPAVVNAASRLLRRRLRQLPIRI
jgi:isoquinoline 1-oxidoreductase beta subunit